MCSHHALPQMPGWRRKLPGQETPRVQKGVLRAGNTQKETSDVERPRDHGALSSQSRGRDRRRKIHTYTVRTKRRRERQAVTDARTQRRSEAERNRARHTGGERDSGTRYGFLSQVKGAVLQGLCKLVAGLPYFPREEADLKGP